jgi:predicted Zn-dependent protease
MGLVRVMTRMEKRADGIASNHEGDAGTYARALEKAYRFNLTPVVLRKENKGVHPDLYDRLVAAGITPSYARPEPPSRVWSRVALTASLLIALPASVGMGRLLDNGEPSAAGALVTGVFTPYVNQWKAWVLTITANQARENDDPGQAAEIYRQAMDLDPSSLDYPVNYVLVLVELKKCDEAETVVKQIRARWGHPSEQNPQSATLLLAAQAIARCRQQGAMNPGDGVKLMGFDQARSAHPGPEPNGP